MTAEKTKTGKFARRKWIRVFFCLIVCVIVVDATPWGILPGDLPKRWISSLACWIGIEQGPWTMFAPNPATRIYWSTAEVTDSEGTHEWSSTYWPTAQTSEKFLHYRYMVFDDRLNWQEYYPANDDFADFLARQHATARDPNVSQESVDDSLPRPSVVLYSNLLELIRPEAGEMPTLDNIAFVASSEAVARSDEQ